MANRPSFPIPIWLIAADLASAALLALGFGVHADERFAAALGLPQAAGIAMLVFGGLGVVASAAAIVRHLRAAAVSRSTFPR